MKLNVVIKKPIHLASQNKSATQILHIDTFTAGLLFARNHRTARLQHMHTHTVLNCKVNIIAVTHHVEKGLINRYKYMTSEK